MDLAAAHRAELEEAAAHYRRRRVARAGRGPSLPLRLYARLWWASRPRVEAMVALR